MYSIIYVCICIYLNKNTHTHNVHKHIYLLYTSTLKSVAFYCEHCYASASMQDFDCFAAVHVVGVYYLLLVVQQRPVFALLRLCFAFKLSQFFYSLVGNYSIISKLPCCQKLWARKALLHTETWNFKPFQIYRGHLSARNMQSLAFLDGRLETERERQRENRSTLLACHCPSSVWTLACNLDSRSKTSNAR